MILTDGSILDQIRTGKISITPYDRKRLGSNSYDLTLGSTLLIYKVPAEGLDCKKDNPVETIIIPDEGFVMHPGILYLGYVNEHTKSSKDLVPCIEGKSSIARLGISVHLTAGFGDCAFAGHFTLEITVVHPIRIYKDMPIAQIYWTMTMGKCHVPYNLKKDAKYHEQPAEPVRSMMFKNFKEELVITSK